MMEISSLLNIEIHVGNLQLITSGVVHLENQTDVKAKIKGLEIIFTFQSDAEKPESRYETKGVENRLTFFLFNHVNPLGEGVLSPLKVAEIDGRPFRITYFVNTLNPERNARRFEYAFYMGQQDD